jgi:DNA-binding GntR family transcriptional regulator
MAKHSFRQSWNLTVVSSETLRTKSRSEFVYDTLRDAIWEGWFARGERIREEEIARSLGRSLVVVELSAQQILELYAMRELLEGAAARFAAQHAAKAEIAMLNRILDEFTTAWDDPNRLVTLNRHFHQAICEAAHNRYLTETLNNLHDALALLHANTFRVPNRPRETDAEHRQIVLAIAQGNPDQAEEAAREHIRQAQRTRFEMLMGNEQPGERAVQHVARRPSNSIRRLNRDHLR